VVDYDPAERFWRFEIPFNELRVLWDKPLGAGFFGLVVSGNYVCLPVAVKFPISAYHPKSLKAMAKEDPEQLLNILRKYRHHMTSEQLLQFKREVAFLR
jgi:hypothetical protein